MDPRNPLARLDALAHARSIARLALSFERRRGEPEPVRRIEVVFRDGRQKSFALARSASWIDLLDRLARALGPKRAVSARRSRRGPRRSGRSRR